jgi:hypothetical protein
METNLREIECDSVGWIHVALGNVELRLFGKPVMNMRFYKIRDIVTCDGMTGSSSDD